MTGYLQAWLAVRHERRIGNTHLQYVLAMQLSQLEKVFLMLSASPMTSLLPSKLSRTISPTPLLILRCIAIDKCGILKAFRYLNLYRGPSLALEAVCVVQLVPTSSQSCIMGRESIISLLHIPARQISLTGIVVLIVRIMLLGRRAAETLSRCTGEVAVDIIVGSTIRALRECFVGCSE
jgi:hypothetical protein